MARIAHKSDGRRIFTAKFKREQTGRILGGELTVAALSRKLGIARSLLHRWVRLTREGSETPSAANGRSTPVGKMGVAQYVRELQLLIGKQVVELELLRAELDALKKRRASAGVSRR